MSEVLSQGEIDALLAALSAGEIGVEEHHGEEKHKVKKYDFKRPNKFSKEHIRTISMVHENFARLVSNYLTSSLRTSVQVKVVSTEQTTFEEFIHSIPNPTMLTSFYLKPFEGLMMFETGPQYVFQIIDILFGGHGSAVSYKTREFTEIEKNIIKKINWKLLENMPLAWEDIIKVEPVFESLETNPVLNQFMAPSEPVAWVTMNVDISGHESFINVCIPYISIEKYMDKFVIQYKTVSTSRNDMNSKIEHNLLNVMVDSTVELGRSTITVEDFLNLSVGDCLMLNQRISEPLNYYIEDRLHFKVYAGTVKNKKIGVQISEILYKDVDNNE